MKRKSSTTLALSIVVALGVGGGAYAGGMAPEARTDSTREPASSADGTRTTGKERDKRATAEQSEIKTDLEITARIRRAVVADESLSMYAHNIKIYTRNGAVTLRGAVRSTREKQVAQSLAEKVAGKGKVTNKLQVKPED